MRNDVLMFLRSWVSEPLRVGAVAPSGETLAEIITREISPAIGPVVELGPGTGVFTTKLLERGVRPEDLTLVETDRSSRRTCKSDFRVCACCGWMRRASMASASLRIHPSARSRAACPCSPLSNGTQR